MNGNLFELVGKVNYINIKYLPSGKSVTRVLLGKKRYNSEDYDSYAVTFFGDLSEQVGEQVVKGDYIFIEGRLTIEKYKSKDGKNVENIALIGNSFQKVTYDTEKKAYVATEQTATKDASKSEQRKLAEDLFGA